MGKEAALPRTPRIQVAASIPFLRSARPSCSRPASRSLSVAHQLPTRIRHREGPRRLARACRPGPVVRPNRVQVRERSENGRGGGGLDFWPVINLNDRHGDLGLGSAARAYDS